MKTQILGTGLSGLVGSRIVELLSSRHEFIDLPIEKGFDITKPETIESTIASSPAGILIHLAAYTDVNGAWKDNGNKNGLCYRVNVLGTKNIAELCQKHQKFLIHFSTDFVFGGKKENPYVEDDQPDPIEWYGETKYLAEEEVKNSGCKFCLVRISFPFRAKFPSKPDLVRKTIDGIKNKTLYPQFTDQIITPTFIDDIAYGIETIIKKRPSGIFHLTGSSFVSPFELAKKIASVFELDVSLIKKGTLAEFLKNNPNSRPYQKNLRLSNQKAGGFLGIKMKTIDEALSEIKKTLTS